ncbi:LPS export ABC transporter periplasmic protein LptC [Mannheimia pernigra]|uniref:LPS export ABC transporter periplasmic protein LptC n=1 Tax=Mannheimia pernigra TaxID=111844 RepID=UPI00131659BF|nr:LPS export ABC transporter periplasmic protein LptC [Mannheimia pernigra]QHB17486.1 LPS export ABC transporter periplasmic protein LptC [Mannheimia pernigra]
MNTRFTIILLIIVAILGGWYYSLKEKDNIGLDHLIKKEGQPEYVGSKISTTVYDLKGNPQYFAQASNIKRYESTERTEFSQPFIELFAKDSTQKQWKVSADYAEITKEKILNLKGNIKLDALDPASRLQQITTDTLTVDLNTQNIFTESAVKSIGSGFTTTGVGLKGNLKQQVATLQKEVKSYIEPTIIKETKE